MSQVIYRELKTEDYPTVKKLISEAFGFNTLIADPKFLDNLLTVYLQTCILDSSFGQIAEKDKKIIGIILGDAKIDKHHLRKPHNFLSTGSTILKLAFKLISKEKRQAMKEFGKVQKAYKELITGKEKDFQGCIQLFIVSSTAQGLGIGSTLLTDLFHYMNKMKVQSLYVYTDSNCNYPFYERKKFIRLAEKKVNFDSSHAALDVYLYEYIF